MFIKAIVIEGAEENITITRTDQGAVATVERFSRSAGKHAKVIAEMRRDESPDARFAQACELAKTIFGTDRNGRPLGTSSMVDDLMTEFARVAGCEPPENKPRAPHRTPRR